MRTARRTKKSQPSPSPQTGMLTAALAGRVFQELGIGVSIFSGGEWQAIHAVPSSVIDLEFELGSQMPRWRHNERCIDQAWAERRSLRSEHAGFHDLFVPLGGDHARKAVLVAGPFALERPTSAEVTQRWNEIAHTRAHFADPAFSRYLFATLDTVTLEGPLFASFEALLSCLARILGADADMHKLARQWDPLAQRLLPTRSAERMWEAARSMVDERTTHIWSTPLKRDPLARLGITGPPAHVVVGLLRGRPDEPDPIDEALRRRAFQRAAVSLAQKRGDVACGQVGEHGVVLLVHFSGGRSRLRAELVDLATRAANLARRFGFHLHAGVSRDANARSLPGRYRAALAAAERALSRKMAVAFAEDRPQLSARTLADLRARLADSVEDRTDVLLARFEQYAEAAIAHAGYQLDPTRVQLEAGLERLAEPFLASGQIDRKSFDEFASSASAGPEGPVTIATLVAGYRRVVADIELAIRRPIAARQNRSTRRALRFLHEHLAEPLTLAQVSRVAGFAPNYFSRLLKREEGATFERYLQTQRLEHAKYVLTSTSATVERVAQLSGFKSRTYFQRVFREHCGSTPMTYRRQPRRRSTP